MSATVRGQTPRYILRAPVPDPVIPAQAGIQETCTARCAAPATRPQNSARSSGVLRGPVDFGLRLGLLLRGNHGLLHRPHGIRFVQRTEPRRRAPALLLRLIQPRTTCTLLVHLLPLYLSFWLFSHVRPLSVRSFSGVLMYVRVSPPASTDRLQTCYVSVRGWVCQGSIAHSSDDKRGGEGKGGRQEGRGGGSLGAGRRRPVAKAGYERPGRRCPRRTVRHHGGRQLRPWRIAHEESSRIWRWAFSKASAGRR